MYLIVGLGNIGKEYEGTRHNAGFDVVNYLSKKLDIKINKVKFKGTIGEGTLDGEKIILLKPSTYMNLSGESVREVMNFYNIPIENVIIIYDDIYIEVGKLRIRNSGSDGGHNGIKSIIANLNSQDFARIRVGTGSPSKDMISFVLGKFSKDEINFIKESEEAAGDAAIDIIKNGIISAMNKYNCFKACQE